MNELAATLGRCWIRSYSRFMSHYFAFVALVAVLVLIPGPAVMLVMQKAMTIGYPGALRVAMGVLTADLVWAAGAAAGVSAVIVASEPAFLTLRFAGAAYLIYLGVRLLLAPKEKLLPSALARPENETVTRVGRPRTFRQGFLCDMTNPKTLLVFTSVIPQFVPAGSSPFRSALLGVTFAALGFASLTLYSLVLARAGGVVRRPQLARRLIRGSGGILVGFGVALVAER
jgi:threonine/homoserine/homoserine lactone efflux protein